jgi:hypothetical protein
MLLTGLRRDQDNRLNMAQNLTTNFKGTASVRVETLGFLLSVGNDVPSGCDQKLEILSHIPAIVTEKVLSQTLEAANISLEQLQQCHDGSIKLELSHLTCLPYFLSGHHNSSKYVTVDLYVGKQTTF